MTCKWVWKPKISLPLHIKFITIQILIIQWVLVILCGCKHILINPCELADWYCHQKFLMTYTHSYVCSFGTFSMTAKVCSFKCIGVLIQMKPRPINGIVNPSQLFWLGQWWKHGRLLYRRNNTVNIQIWNAWEFYGFTIANNFLVTLSIFLCIFVYSLFEYMFKRFDNSD